MISPGLADDDRVQVIRANAETEDALRLVRRALEQTYDIDMANDLRGAAGAIEEALWCLSDITYAENALGTRLAIRIRVPDWEPDGVQQLARNGSSLIAAWGTARRSVAAQDGGERHDDADQGK